MAQLQSAAIQQNASYTGQAAQDTANCLHDMTLAVRAVAATSQDRQLQTRIIQQADTVMDRALNLVDEAKNALHSREFAKSLTAATKSVTMALSDCVNCLPGQQDLDDVIAGIDDASQILAMNEFPVSNKPYG